MLIVSPKNPAVQGLRLLHTPKGRQEAGTFLAEGQRCIDGLIAEGWKPVRVFLEEDREFPKSWPTDVPCVVFSPSAMKVASPSTTPPGFLAEFPLPKPPPIDERTSALVLVGVQDPGNVGTLIRSAAAFGIPQVILVGTADPFSPKALQASAGAIAAPNIHRFAIDIPVQSIPCQVRRIALVIDGQPLQSVASRDPAWLMIGSEGHGLNAAWQAVADVRATIPMQRQVESLNAGVAGSIACYAFFGQD